MAVATYMNILYGGNPEIIIPYTVETHLTTTSLKRPPLLKTTFWPERNISLYFMFDFASLIRPAS